MKENGEVMSYYVCKARHFVFLVWEQFDLGYLYPSSAPCVEFGQCMSQVVLVNLEVLDHL